MFVFYFNKLLLILYVYFELNLGFDSLDIYNNYISLSRYAVLY